MKSGRRRALVVAASLAGLLLGPLAAGALPPPSAGWDGDFFAEGVLGTWVGEGDVYGNPVRLTRDWSFDLAGRFLRADMRVEMANGASFRALGYWSHRGENAYRIIWMDEMGIQRDLIASGDPQERSVTTFYLDESTDEYPGWRRLSFRIEGPDRYVETMHARSGGDWEQVARFVFTRAEAQ